MTSWSPSSWRSCPVAQDVIYPDPDALNRSLDTLRSLPPLVWDAEVDQLRSVLADCAVGKRFLLQGGDCAESFTQCSEEPVKARLKILLQMSLILVWGLRKPIVRVARMAGQYAKPRSKPTEILPSGKEVLAFRGEIVNGLSVDEREPDPSRLLEAYFRSAATLNFSRSLLGAGFASLAHPQTWQMGHIKHEEVRNRYEDIVSRVLDALSFSATVDSSGVQSHAITAVDLYTSHEALHLPYEECMTRATSAKEDGDAASSPAYYNTSAHMVWVGDRTRQLDSAHIEFVRGIQNPVGVKVGPTTEPAALVKLLRIINPHMVPGKCVLITRFGADKVRTCLPPVIAAVLADGWGGIVVWSCDPMHGNTRTLGAKNTKTRFFADILTEITATIDVHKECGSIFGGVHLELTGDIGVTECVGGAMELSEQDLERNYTSFCDPRLNCEQSLDIALEIAARVNDRVLVGTSLCDLK